MKLQEEKPSIKKIWVVPHVRIEFSDKTNCHYTWQARKNPGHRAEMGCWYAS